LPKIRRSYSYRCFAENGGTTISRITYVKKYWWKFWKIIAVYRQSYNGEIIRIK